MDSLNAQVEKYALCLKEGHIQRAYSGIMNFMSSLKAYLESRHPDYLAGSLYLGYMDMTYFSFTPAHLRDRKLKVAVVFLHEACAFELWLSADNRALQAEYVERLQGKPLGGYALSGTGEDSIVRATAAAHPNFDDINALKEQLEERLLAFVGELPSILQWCE